MKALVLDSEAVNQLARSRDGHNPKVVHAALRAARRREAPVLVPAAVLSELYRGRAREQAIDSWLGRAAGTRIVDTDQGLARQIGRILDRARCGSEHHVDATVVATAISAGGGLILTADPDDLTHLSAHASNVTIARV